MGDMTDVAMKLRDEFDDRAAELDASAGIPTKNYEQMREAGYLRATAPTELGGLGADMAEFGAAQRALGWGCASTALMVNMHLFQVGAAAERWRIDGSNEAVLRRVVDDGIVLASTAAEAVVAGEWHTPTTAVRDGDDYIITGHKYFCSEADVMDLCRVNATDPETGEIVVVAVPAAAEGLSVVQTWDTLGMRGTCSNDLVLDQVRVPASAIGVRLPADGPAWHPAFASVIRWFLSGVSGVYLGIADRARHLALTALDGPGHGAHRDRALTEVMVGKLEAAHFRGAATHALGLQLIAGAADPVEGLTRAITMKEETITAAHEVVERAAELAGGRSFYRKSTLERLTRDVRAAKHHPPAAPVSYQMVGKGLMPPSPSAEQ